MKTDNFSQKSVSKLIVHARTLNLYLRLRYIVAPILFCWPLCCLFFFDLRIMITLLVSSNSSIQNFKLLIYFGGYNHVRGGMYVLHVGGISDDTCLLFLFQCSYFLDHFKTTIPV